MPSQQWVSVCLSFVCLFVSYPLDAPHSYVIGSYKHTVYYVMQIGAITHISMLSTVTEHLYSCYKQNGTAVLDVSNVLCEYKL